MESNSKFLGYLHTAVDQDECLAREPVRDAGGQGCQCGGIEMLGADLHGIDSATYRQNAEIEGAPNPRTALTPNPSPMSTWERGDYLLPLA